MTTTYDVLIDSKECEGSIKNWANDSRIPSKTILEEAEQWIYKILRIRQMLRNTTGTLAKDAETVALSSFAGYKSPYFFMFTPTATLVKSIPRFKPLDFVVGQWAYDGTGARIKRRPSYWSTDDVNMQFDLVADVAYPFIFYYYRSLPALSPTNKTNVLTTEYLSLLRYACLRYAFEHLRHEKFLQYYTAATLSEANSVNEDSDLQLLGMQLEVDIIGDGFDSLAGYGNL